MEHEPLSLVVVAHEKDLKEMVRALKSLSRKIPFQLQCATQAIDGPGAFNRIYERTGKLDGCFFHSRFTATGREPYAEILGKTLKRKFAATPIIGFGKKSKAGSRGKNFHEFLDVEEGIDLRALLEILMRLQDGDIQTKTEKKEYRRLSLEEDAVASTLGETNVKKSSAEAHERRAFPRNENFRKQSWTAGSTSQPGSSPGSSPYFNNTMFKPEGPSTMYSTQGSGLYSTHNSAPQTPSGVRTPTSSYSSSSQLLLNGSPNAELIHQLTLELEKLKSIVYERKAHEILMSDAPSHLEALTRDE